MKRILVNAAVCTGCRACQIACVAHHDGRFGLASARLHVVKDEPQGLDLPQACRLCKRAPCVSACPVDALARDERTGAVVLRAEACIGCAGCVDACPFGMAALHPETGLALICDLCAGQPACVARCASGAIVYAEEGAAARGRREAWAHARRRHG